MGVSIHPAFGRKRRLVQMPAVLAAAAARLDKHDGPLHVPATRALEGHEEGAGADGLAATAVHARAAVVGPVEADAAAAGVGEANGLGRLPGAGALLPFLDGREERERERRDKRMI